MKDRPNILCEVGARSHGVIHLVFFAAVWVAAIAFALAVPGLPGWWVVCWIAAATLTVVIVAGHVLPLVVGGGTYRVVVQDGWLRVESPHQALGSSFAVALPAIRELVVRTSSEWSDAYEIHTQSGETFLLENGVGEKVFQALRQLHAEIPIARRGYQLGSGTR
jgi:hypothetical protein